MPTLTAVLRSEVRRLAAKEVKKAIARMRRVQRQVRGLRQITRTNRRTLRALQRNVSRLGARAVARGQGALGRGRGLTADAIATLRSRLRMTRVQFAKLVGVSAGSIFGWETGRTLPRGHSASRLMTVKKMGVRAARAKVGAPARRKPRRGRKARRRAARRRVSARSMAARRGRAPRRRRGRGRRR